MPWPKIGATHYFAQLGHAIKGWDVCNSWELEPYDMLNSLFPGCYQLRPLRYDLYISYITGKSKTNCFSWLQNLSRHIHQQKDIVSLVSGNQLEYFSKKTLILI